jgi:ligand-binding sensor domain-containing protein
MGIYKYNEKEENFEPVPFCKGMKAKNLIFDASGNLWVILDGKLVKYNVQLDDHQTYNIPDNVVLTSFCYTSTEKIWLVLSNGMLYQLTSTTVISPGARSLFLMRNTKIRNLTTVYPTLSEDSCLSVHHLRGQAVRYQNHDIQRHHEQGVSAG